jgi:hypothetical protein
MAFLACPKNVTCGGAIKVSGDDKGGDPKKKGVARRVWPMTGGLACIGKSSRCWTKEGGAKASKKQRQDQGDAKANQEPENGEAAGNE